jgi:ubiquinone/menaquinone biosynthesis C-methylase UbiE
VEAARDLIRFGKYGPVRHYVGIDIEGSPEVRSRTRTDGEFRTYDGYTLPFSSKRFHALDTRRVFEHVRYPDRIMRELRRVIQSNGYFVGSLSYLEPYHSHSIFNYTPYGLYRILNENGFRLEKIRPGIEGVSLIVRQLTARRVARAQFAYPAISLAAKIAGWDTRRVNYMRLRFSGHICFAARPTP